MRVIDLLGGITVTACLSGFVWLTAFGSDEAITEIAQLTSLVQTAQRQTRTVWAAREGQRKVLRACRAALAVHGRLPDRAPIDRYFQSLSATASEHGLQVIRHHPLTVRRYPGLLEQRFIYEVAGTTLDIVRFLKAIEDAEFWADVSYLRVTRTVERAARDSTERVATLTISLFSAPPPDPAAESEGA